MKQWYLYRFTCKPNHPVCDAELIFYIDCWSDAFATTRLEWLANNGYYFANATKEAKLEYLGQFKPGQEFKDQIITYQTGEY